MESEKVKEIKKIVRYFADKYMTAQCIGVPKRELFAEILTLINELESKNERLKQSNKNILFVNEQVIEENKKLKDRIAELENTIKNNLQYAKGYGEGVKATVEVAYPKKLNEFAERLKEKSAYSFIFGKKFIVEKDIDETLKEFIKQ